MNKEQFLAAVREKLTGLPQGDIARSLDYYGEMIDDRTEDGMTEEQAVEAMGSVEAIAAQILMDTPLPKPVKTKVQSTHSLRAWEIVLLVLGSPIWLSLLLAAAIVLFSVYVVIWAVIVVLYAADLTFAAGGLAGIASGALLVLTGNLIQALLLFGAGLICAGIAILLFFAFNQVAMCIIKLSKWSMRRMKARFIKKEDVK